MSLKVKVAASSTFGDLFHVNVPAMLDVVILSRKPAQVSGFSAASIPTAPMSLFARVNLPGGEMGFDMSLEVKSAAADAIASWFEADPLGGVGGCDIPV
jgi:hypothetical protein